MEKVSITIDGFKNKETAISFMEWYSNSGEQAIGYWLEDARNEEDPSIATGIYCKSIDEEALKMTVECYN